jgi:hypothetical protein
LPDGRILNLKINKLDVPIKGGLIFEITTPQDEILLVDNLIECANIVGVSRSTLHSVLKKVNEAKFNVTIKGYKIRRIDILLG